MRANIKPITHWIIYKKYTVRYRERKPTHVTGTLSTPEGQVGFTYFPQTMTIELPEQTVQINEYGWEVEAEHG